MCTLSWQHYSDHLEILFNRDELRTRQQALPPQIDRIGNCKVMAPLDPQGGGTWMASNEYGLTVCLLNNYQDRSGKGTWRSRGLLVRALASEADLVNVGKRLHEMALADYQPFLLVAFSGTQSLVHWRWDGQSLNGGSQPESPVTTSSLYPRFIPALRRGLFRRATRNGSQPLTLQKQMALHTSRRPWPPAFAVAMTRRDRGTVSLTRVSVTPTSITMHYWPGDPVKASNQDATQTLLAFQSSNS